MIRTLRTAADVKAGQTLTIAHGRCWPAERECVDEFECGKLHGVATMAGIAGQEIAVEVDCSTFQATR